mgnify:CR=1 FL=1
MRRRHSSSTLHRQCHSSNMRHPPIHLSHQCHLAMTKDKSKRTDYKLYALMRRRHNNELKQLLLDHSHMTIAEASNALGIEKSSLRKMAYDFGVGFQRTKSEGLTRVNKKPVKYKNYKTDVSLSTAPWERTYNTCSN